MSRTRPVMMSAAAAVLVLSACSATDDAGDTGDTAPDASVVTEGSQAGAPDASGEPAGDTAVAVPRVRFRYPPPPSAPGADVQSDPEPLAAIDTINSLLLSGSLDLASVTEIGESGDLRHAWYLSDLLRFFRGAEGDRIVEAFEQLSGVQIADDPESEISPWLSVTNHLIAWDTPAYAGYREDKSGIFLQVEPKWAPFFDDEDALIDWRTLSWGGVLIDDREFGDQNPCERGCIPALDDPEVSDAAGGDWYPDDLIVFGLVEGGEALAIPKNMAEIHEMFNLSLGGRRFGIPYCTLCGSAQAYYTDESGAAEMPVLRTSGLLTRSNKVMYDLVTMSVFDTFTGDALSGPLQDAGVTLDEATLVRTTWGEWKTAHPDTTIIAEDGGIGREYDLDPLAGRDDDGPIFPIGDADERLDVQELVVGVINAEGAPVAFPADLARRLLAAGGDVSAGGVSLVNDGGGLRAIDAATGADVAAHESFWFAWSQFHPDTVLFAP